MPSLTNENIARLLLKSLERSSELRTSIRYHSGLSHGAKTWGQVISVCIHQFPKTSLFLTEDHRYGGPAPRVNGSVALDLHRMNKIIEVNDQFAYAVVEPGVTFTDLYNYCVSHELKVWPSTASLGWGSVMGNVSQPSSFRSTVTSDGTFVARPWTVEWGSAQILPTTKSCPGSR